jgi:hypothetical protein
MCTKASAPPFSGWINPNPLAALNHFTVPVFKTFDLKSRGTPGNMPQREAVSTYVLGSSGATLGSEAVTTTSNAKTG